MEVKHLTELTMSSDMGKWLMLCRIMIKTFDEMKHLEPIGNKEENTKNALEIEMNNVDTTEDVRLAYIKWSAILESICERYPIIIDFVRYHVGLANYNFDFDKELYNSLSGKLRGPTGPQGLTGQDGNVSPYSFDNLEIRNKLDQIIMDVLRSHFLLNKIESNYQNLSKLNIEIANLRNTVNNELLKEE